MELQINELFLIAGLRTFHSFFLINHYLLKELSYNDRTGEYIVFSSYRKNEEIAFYLGSYNTDIVFNQKTRLFFGKEQTFSVSDIIKHFPGYENFKTAITKENMLERMEQYRKFIERHLMPVVKGEKWIDDILKDLK